MSEPFHTITFDVNAISDGLGLSQSVVMSYFMDGRRGGPLIENRVPADLGGVKALSEGAPYDWADDRGDRWEIRSVTKGGVSFAPSNNTGAGRSFVEAEFLDKLDNIAGYICGDLTKFPEVPCYKVSAEAIRTLYHEGALGKNAKLSSPSKFIDVVVTPRK